VQRDDGERALEAAMIGLEIDSKSVALENDRDEARAR
jgi:hypothetical protein